MPKINWSTGVYQIKNSVNGKVYVGSAAKSLEGRINTYKWMLPRRKCHNRHLQAAWNKYGRVSFYYRILERCSPIRCIEREQYWIDKLQAADPRFGYNICPTAGSALGRKMSKEFCRAISLRLKGIPASEESKRKQSETRKGMFTSLQKKSLEKARKCRKNWAVSEEARCKMSVARLGRKLTEESIRKRTEKQTGMKRSEEAKKRMSLAAIERCKKFPLGFHSKEAKRKATEGRERTRSCQK